MPVNRCVCHDLSFESLLSRADDVGGNFDALCAQTGCGSGCGMCAPYVQLMLHTRRTSFPILSPRRVQRLLEMSPHDAETECDALERATRRPSTPSRGVGASPGVPAR